MSEHSMPVVGDVVYQASDSNPWLCNQYKVVNIQSVDRKDGENDRWVDDSFYVLRNVESGESCYVYGSCFYKIDRDQCGSVGCYRNGRIAGGQLCKLWRFSKMVSFYADDHVAKNHKVSAVLSGGIQNLGVSSRGCEVSDSVEPVDAAKSGKSKLADELKDLVQEVRQIQKDQRICGAVPIARPTGELAGLLSVTYPKVLLSEMVLSNSIRIQLQKVTKEYKQISRLREHGLSPRRKLLLVGPPGCGKTMTSRALAGELKLPHFAVQLHSLITKYMGETATKLYAVFEAINKTRGVFMFDEFDAIGSERTVGNDVGEIRRVLNSFLQFLEQDDSDSLIIAATNLPSVLDEALYRRFDEVILYEKPTKVEIEELIRNRLARFHLEVDTVEMISGLAIGLSHADICQSSDDAAKEAVLKGSKFIEFDLFKDAVLQRQSRRSLKNEEGNRI